MHIGLLHCGHTSADIAERHGDFVDMFEVLFDGHGLVFHAYDVENMEFPESVTARDGWLISGSKHGAYETHAFIPPLEHFIRDAYALGVPQVGICFGHQIMAQAMGGRVIKTPGGWGLGRMVYTMGERDVALNAWHQDQVVETPLMSDVIAGNDFCPNAALIYGSRALSFQPHPEFSDDVLADYIETRRGTGTYPDDRMNAAQTRLRAPLDRAYIATVISTFFKDAHYG